MDPQIEILFKKYLQAELSREELLLVRQLIQSGVHQAEWERAISADAAKVMNSDLQLEMSREERNRLYSRIRQSAGIPKSRRLWLRVAAVAAVAAMVLGVWVYSSRFDSSTSLTDGGDLYANDIAPGRSAATLTLANGKKIVLSSSQTAVVMNQGYLKYGDNTPVMPGNDSSSLASGTDFSGDIDPSQGTSTRETGSERGAGGVQMLVASTPRAGTYQLVLQDGSRVWLNADSKLEFPSDFRAGRQRIVKLSGEAYFEIAKDAAHPFIVESSGQRVQVLGTHFNVNSYADEGSVKTTLLEGSVSVSSGFSGAGFGQSGASKSLSSASKSLSGYRMRGDAIGDTKSGSAKVLKPGQQSVNKRGVISVSQVNVADAVAWKDGLFAFKRAPLEAVMRQVAKWYDVEVSFDSPVLKKITFTGSISRYSKVSKLLKAIEFTGGVKFKISGRKVTVTQR